MSTFEVQQCDAEPVCIVNVDIVGGALDFDGLDTWHAFLNSLHHGSIGWRRNSADQKECRRAY
jgi:hypothetical protein